MGLRSYISVWNDLWLPSTRSRPANKNQHNLYSDLTVDSLIDVTSKTWNSQAIRTLVDPQDAKIIESIPLNRFQVEDRDGWHFTKSGRYTVKSGYQVKQVYPDSGWTLPEYGPSVLPLKVHCWKVPCTSKIKHFLATSNMMYSGKEKFTLTGNPWGHNLCTMWSIRRVHKSCVI